jgi:hypothetical protein
MAQKQTAIVVVSKDWINTGVRFLVNHGKKSGTIGGSPDTHLVIAPVDDASDHRGLWLKGITTTELTTDTSPVTLKFMIPWSFVLGLGLIDGERNSVGFKAGETTHVFSAADAD